MRLVPVITRVIFVGGFFTSIWALFLGTWAHGDGSTRDEMRRLTGQLRGLQAPPSPSPRAFRVLWTPTPTPRPPVPEIFDVRNCVCADDWVALSAAGKPSCKCGNDLDCPAFVTPRWVTRADGQDVCSLRERTGFSCTLTCNADGKISWWGHACGKEAEGQAPCPPLVVSPTPSPTGTRTPLPPVPAPAPTWEPADVVDLRGATCERLDGVERCYTEDSQGRTLCPAYVTVEYLTANDPSYTPHECLPAPGEAGRRKLEQWYCTIQCQDGNDVVRWWPQEVSRCYAPGNAGACPPRPTVVPAAAFTVRPWSAHEDGSPHGACRAAAAAGEKPKGVVPELTVGLLTHEPRALALSLKTYEDLGLFDVIDEFLVYVNGRHAGIDAVLDPYAAKHRNVRIMGNATNIGIAGGMVALTRAARNPYFLFLERDFQLVEPATCVDEQLRAGIDLIKAGAAHVIRYRSRRHAGRPNWAETFFAGHEDDAFVGRQPNLGCNVFYWVGDVTGRWPQYFWACGENPEMVCSDAYYCNWTNNPQLWSIKWWDDEYVSQFGSFKRSDPWYDLESYMNWEPNSWNDRGWIVAQGDGLWKHVDPTKF